MTVCSCLAGASQRLYWRKLPLGDLTPATEFDPKQTHKIFIQTLKVHDYESRSLSLGYTRGIKAKPNYLNNVSDGDSPNIFL